MNSLADFAGTPAPTRVNRSMRMDVSHPTVPVADPERLHCVAWQLSGADEVDEPEMLGWTVQQQLHRVLAWSPTFCCVLCGSTDAGHDCPVEALVGTADDLTLEDEF